MKGDKSIIAGLILGAAVALLFTAHASAQSKVTEEFHQVYALNSGGSVDLRNINGFVHITAWDRNEVKVDAVKWAYKPERLKEAEIRVSASPERVSIRTHYDEDNQHFCGDCDDNPATVDYTLTVPAGARLDSIKLINGDLTVQGVTGEVRGNSINGRVKADGLRGRTELSTINGPVDATFTVIAGDGRVRLSSINGEVTVVLPSDAQTELEAKTVHGDIRNDFGVPVQHGRYVGQNLEARMGSGGARVELKNVNGEITLKRASDGKTPSPITNLLREREMDD